MIRVSVTVILSIVLAAGAAQAQQRRPPPVCRPGFLRGAEGCAPMATFDLPSNDATAVFSTEDSSDHFSVLGDSRSGPLRCADISRNRPCTLHLDAQALHVEVSGDASFGSTLTVPRGSTMFRFERRGRGLLIVGLTLIGVGVGVAGLGGGMMAVGANSHDLGGILAIIGGVFFLASGGVMTLIGLPIMLVDLFRAQVHINSMPLPRSIAQDPISSVFPREPGSGYAMTPILSLPVIRF